jgi:hypothetical protein
LTTSDTAPITTNSALSGKLRIGLAAQTVLASLAQAVVLTPPSPGKHYNTFQAWFLLMKLKARVCTFFRVMNPE